VRDQVSNLELIKAKVFTETLKQIRIRNKTSFQFLMKEFGFMDLQL